MNLIYLQKNSFCIKYTSTEKLLDKFHDTYFNYYKNAFEPSNLIKEGFILIGEYNDGYLFVKNAYSIIPEDPTEKITIVNGVEITHTYLAQFYYFQDKIMSPNVYVVDLNLIYSKGYLDDLDLLDIQRKFNEWKDYKYPYCIAEHYPIK